MWCLRIGKKPCEWVKCETIGKQPIPRIHHSMNYYEEGNYIIIHGGSNEIDSKEESVLGDLFMFELSKFEWMEITVKFTEFNQTVENRCGHSSIIFCNLFLIKQTN